LGSLSNEGVQSVRVIKNTPADTDSLELSLSLQGVEGSRGDAEPIGGLVSR
jgi:hypothetical protein